MRIVTHGMAIAVAALSLTGSALGAPVETVLVSFNNTNGAQPIGGLISDGAGDLFGTTLVTVFEIPKTSTGYNSTPITLASFNNTNGAQPIGGLISDAGGQFLSLAEPWADTSTGTGRLMIAVLGGLADVERDLIRTRTGEGRERAKARGQHMGRPPKMTPSQKQEARRRRKDGESVADLSRSYGVSPAAIYRTTA
jgi:Resolvase, N terminal domain/Helix-turn-helix domain of resolvase